MGRHIAVVVGVLLVSHLAVPAQALDTIAPRDLAFFEKKVRPVLARHCYQCHSADAAKLRGGLLLDSKAGVMHGGDRGEVAVPGDPAASRLIQAVRYENDKLQMPPKSKLSDAEIAALERWVKMGAPDPRTGGAKVPERPAGIDIEKGRQYWAFQPVRRSPPPAVKNKAWPSDDIDRFVLAKLEAEGLHPVGDAGRVTLIRRATFDLTGLPPTSADVEAFVDDPGDDRTAFAKVVDRLLASPRYGERWGRHWLDVARYAESVGGSRNVPLHYAWRYRDYVIASFNEDKSYDQFIVEQVAGDLLESPNAKEQAEDLVATGFLALGSFDLNETNKRIYKANVVDEQIDTTGRAFMALTLGCARCHDHKFDPVSQADYYALAGIFYSTQMRSGLQNKGGKGGYVNPNLLVSLPEEDRSGEQNSAADERNRRKAEQHRKQVDALENQVDDTTRRIQQLKKQIKQATVNRGKKNKRRANADKTAPSAQQLRKQQAAAQTQLRDLKRRLQRLTGKGPAAPKATNVAMGAVDNKQVADTKLHIKGDSAELGETIRRGFVPVATDPAAPLIEIDRAHSGRLQLAQWLARAENPLTARVMANRIWHHLLGRGIVATVDNFGDTGDRPTHPQLLDHLAARFVDSGWSVKQTIRAVMLSRTYRLSSTIDTSNDGLDPDNKLLWRANLKRLEIEAIRDSMLAISGEIDLTHPGPSPVFKFGNGEIGQAKGNVNVGTGGKHRSVYVPVVRGKISPMFETFNFTDSAEVKGRRDVTTVAPQALFMMNNTFVLASAGRAADRLLAEGERDDTARIGRAYALTLGRAPTNAETAAVAAFVADQKAPAAKRDASRDTWAAVFHALFASAEFRYLH